MINLRNSPFLWIALTLLFSYRVAGFIGPLSNHWLILFIWSVCGGCLFLSLFKYNPRYQYLSSIVIGVLIFAAGMIRFSQFNKSHFPDGILTQPVDGEGFVKVVQVLKNKDFSASLKCERIFLASRNDPEQNVIDDKYILVFARSNETFHYFPGDFLTVKGKLSAIGEPLNPYGFDAKKYYKTIGIRHQIYCREGDVQQDTTFEKSISRLAAMWQLSLSALVKNNISEPPAQLTNALVWGDRSDMDNDVRDAFADSGAMHVLSVSGMHVAIIYSILFLILGPPASGTFFRRLLRFTTYSMAILLYVALTGACPAVVRAGLMIILYLFGKAMGWNTQVWILLGFAAFVMFWINRYLWQNIGFQISFLAIAGILLFSKPMIRCISFRYKILHHIWEITVLSIVAQVFILPILLGQFHQFPLTFIISSLVAVPAGYLIVFGALLNVILAFFDFDFAWPLLDWTGKLFIRTMEWMAGLNPEMYFSLPAISGAFLMSMAVLLSIGIVFKWAPGKKLACFFSILTLITMAYHRFNQWNVQETIIYHSYKGMIIDHFAHGKCISFHSPEVSAGNIEFTTRGYRCHRDIIDVADIFSDQEFQSRDYSLKTSILTTPRDSILLWQGSENEEICKPKFSYIIIDQCPDEILLKDYIMNYHSLVVVLPAHLNRKLKSSIEQFLKENKIAFHDIDQDGYLIIPG
jgi:competence protein ComEC